MKNIIWIFFFVFLVQGINCNEGILSKFHQSGYKVKDLRIQLMSYNKSYFNFLEVKAFKYNRTTTAHNLTANLKVDTKDLVEVIVQVDKFLSNEYRHFPLRFQINLKKAFDSNAIGMGALKNCGKLTTFYIYKNITYHACNFVVDETRFPPLMPNGKYRTTLIFSYLNAEIALFYLYGEVITTRVLPME